MAAPAVLIEGDGDGDVVGAGGVETAVDDMDGDADEREDLSPARRIGGRRLQVHSIRTVCLSRGSTFTAHCEPTVAAGIAESTTAAFVIAM